MLSHLAPGARVQNYIVEGIIGVGGTGIVVRVRRVDDRSPHAMKFLHLRGGQAAERFLREGKIQATLRHPNVLRVTDVLRVSETTSDLALVMDLVEGPTLGAWARRHEPTFAEVDQLAEQLFAGLEHAHRAGVVHRDIKPENILLQRREDTVQVLISDFGIARVLETSGPLLTGEGDGLGTPNYMAPEQYQDGSLADERADIYALGALLYELLSGAAAFNCSGVEGARHAAAKGEFVPLDVRRPDAPKRMVAAIEAALQPHPDRRPPSVSAFRAMWRGGTEPERGWTSGALHAATRRHGSLPPNVAATLNFPGEERARRPLLLAFVAIAGLVLLVWLLYINLPT